MASETPKTTNTLCEVARYCLGLVEVVIGYIPKMLTPRDPEDLHQFRVHLRKLRSILLTYDVLFPKKELTFFIRRVEELAQATNIARDLDVHQEILEQEINSVSPAFRIGLRTLRNKWKVERHNVQMQMHEIITLRQRDGFFSALIDWLNTFITEPVKIVTPVAKYEPVSAELPTQESVSSPNEESVGSVTVEPAAEELNG